MTEYLSCVVTAKLIRAALKKAFPEVKFSVRSSVYSGGASVDVGWTDGPCSKAVEQVAKPFACGGFDGMIDMAYSKTAWLLPDGTAAFGSSEGTEGSRGSCPSYDNPAPAEGAKKVHFGADYVFCNKSWSVEKYTAAVAKVCTEWGVEMPEVKVTGGTKPDPYVAYVPVPNAGMDLSTLVHRELQSENRAWQEAQWAKEAAA